MTVRRIRIWYHRTRTQGFLLFCCNWIYSCSVNLDHLINLMYMYIFFFAQLLTWTTQFCTFSLTQFLDMHLKVLKILYHASAFVYLDCQGRTLGAMPMHFGSRWNHQMQYQRGFMARSRFVFTGKQKILYLCTYLHNHTSNAAICSLSRNWLREFVMLKCIYRNASIGLCQCEKDEWKTVPKQLWSTVMSPYQDRYIDVKLVDGLSGSITVSVEEGWHLTVVQNSSFIIAFLFWSLFPLSLT